MSDTGKRPIKAARAIGVDHGTDMGSVRTEWVMKEFHDAEIERLTRERDEARRSALEADDAGRSVMSALVKQIEETKHARNQRDEARAAALREAASVRGWWLGVDGHGEPDGTYCSVKPSDDPNARLYVNAEAILALIDKQAPTNG